jgi:glycosyltransferase involved in cell wall biosynthesis
MHVDPDDVSAITTGIKNLLEDDALRKELTQKGLDKAKQYSIERFSNHLLTVLEKIGPSGGAKGSP